MKKIITISSLLFSFYIKAQLFNGAGGLIQDNGQDTYFNLSVSGLSPAQLDNNFGIKQVGININHPAVEELSIYLRSPSGNVVQLTEGTSCNGSNYTNTYFNSQLSTSITLGTAPYTGNYKPIGYLGRFNAGLAGNGVWQLLVHDGFAFINPGHVVGWSIQFGYSPPPSVAFTSSNLPIVIMNTGNQIISDSKILVSMGIIDNGLNRNYLTDPMNNYNSNAMVKFRGNSTRIFEKKPYSFETTDGAGHQLDVSLLGMPPENDWDLIAMYQDKSLIRVPLSYDLSRQMGNYSTRFKTVEVVINSEYKGVYLLIEKPKWGQFRIDIPKLNPTDNSYPQITGGYIIKIDRAQVGGWYSLHAGAQSVNAHFYYQHSFPNDTAITTQQKTYIKNFMDNFETVISASSFADPVNGYQKYIDVKSFVDYFIVNELSKNVDAYRLSTYLYKDNIAQGGKLHIGPVWDYDLAWHNCNYGNSFDPTGWQYQLTDTMHPTPIWWSRFMQDTSFVNALYCRWNELRQGILTINNLNNYIDARANLMGESEQRNFIQWPILGAYIYPNPQSQLNANYQGEVTDLKNWIVSRLGWMDGAINGNCIALNVKENSIDNNLLVYPNPFQSTTTFAMNLTEDADVSLKIIDAI